MENTAAISHKKWLDHQRFRWHEAILRDPRVRKHPCALALAGHIMHRFHPGKGYAQFSASSAAKALSMPERSVKRAARYLRRHNWIRQLDDQTAGRWGAAAYILLGGPDDLDFADGSTSDADDTEGAVT